MPSLEEIVSVNISVMEVAATELSLPVTIDGVPITTLSVVTEGG